MSYNKFGVKNLGGQIVSVVVLTVALVAGSLAVQNKTSVINKAADSCNSISVVTMADQITCENTYFSSLGYGCHVVAHACFDYTASNCPTTNGCVINDVMTSCSGLVESTCKITNGCTPNYDSKGYCTFLKEKDRYFCAGKPTAAYCGPSTRCKWVNPVYQSCSGSYKSGNKVCGGDKSWFTCNSTPKSCEPGTTRCDSRQANFIITCSANGGGETGRQCTSGTCHPADAYHSQAYCQ
jgi:hypothetical protein